MSYDEPFILYRTVLFIALAAYYGVTTAATVWQIGLALCGRDPRKRLLRLYLSYQLLSFRVRPLAGELLQILFWCTILGAVWWLHTLL